MPCATNPLDGVRSFVEDWGGGGSPVLVYAGLADPIEEAQGLPLVQALASDYRMIFADHRGHGRSDKPHDPQAYALPTRVADATAVLDELGIDRAHVLGFSWGARLGFAIGEHAPARGWWQSAMAEGAISSDLSAWAGAVPDLHGRWRGYGRECGARRPRDPHGNVPRPGRRLSPIGAVRVRSRASGGP